MCVSLLSVAFEVNPAQVDKLLHGYGNSEIGVKLSHPAVPFGNIRLKVA